MMKLQHSTVYQIPTAIRGCESAWAGEFGMKTLDNGGIMGLR